MPFQFAKPILSFLTAADPDADQTQDFNMTVYGDIDGYYIRLVGSFGSAAPSEPYDIDQSVLIDAAAEGGLLAQFTVRAIAIGLCSFKARIQFGSGISGLAESDWTNTVSKTIAASPHLLSPIDASTGTTTGSGSVSTNTGNGTLYWVVSISATKPTAAQVKAGKIHTGATASDSGSQAVSSTGIQSISGGFTGLAEGIAYYAHYMQESTLGYQSLVSSGDGFTTDTGKTFTYCGSAQYGGSSNTFTASIDIGTAAADRLVIVEVNSQNAPTLVSVVANGVTLTQDVVQASGQTCAIYSGVVPTGSGAQNIVLTTTSGAFFDRSMFVHTATGLSSNLKKNTAHGTATTVNIAIDAGDFLVAGLCITSGYLRNFNSSTQAPTANHGQAAFGLSAYWTVAETNASFAITESGAGSNKVGASYS